MLALQMAAQRCLRVVEQGFQSLCAATAAGAAPLQEADAAAAEAPEVLALAGHAAAAPASLETNPCTGWLALQLPCCQEAA
jgi:hypothetical protein